MELRAPFPYFGGKSAVAGLIWERLGSPKQYIEPFCGSAAVLLSAPVVAPLEVVNDLNGFIANFWRSVKYQPEKVAGWADYPVSHIDLGARHNWLMDRAVALGDALQDPEWPGDAQAAGWWLWGQCSWIGSGWCNWGKVPYASDAGMGVQARGQIPHASNAGMGVQARGQIPHTSDAGMGVQARGRIPHTSDAGMGIQLTSGGLVALEWLHRLATRLERTRLIHGDWNRCLNNHYGGSATAVFLDPPYRGFEHVFSGALQIADAVESWARDHAMLRIALCGLKGDYDLRGWDIQIWKRPRPTYLGSDTTNREAIWFSPACLPARKSVQQGDLFDDSAC